MVKAELSPLSLNKANDVIGQPPSLSGLDHLTVNELESDETKVG